MRKQQVFFAYAAYDPHVCDTEAVCSHLGYGSWLPRQYTLPYTITGAAVEGVALQQTTMSHIALLPPASSSLAGATTTAPTEATTFHLPFVGLDIPTLTSIVTDVSEESDMYVSSQPAVVIRGWISDNELSEATTSTV